MIGNVLASSFIMPSDLRYKKNIQEINSPLSKLKQVRGVTYQYKRDEFPTMGFTDAVQIGFIAQERKKYFRNW
ncbi:MAG: tail fiber domain-containing protein [Chitinophagaceae bacterium]|nr:tail fiber domain-containing protein [Chitinophagaceae bacterium]